MKRVFLGLGMAAAILMLGGSSASAAVLYDQLAAPPGAAGTTSQKFSDMPNFTNQAADDFTVPAGVSWQLSEVDVAGTGSGTAAPVNVYVYANNGTLPGAQLFAQADIAATGFPNYVVPLSGAPKLPPGTYWLSVQQGGSFAGNGQWYWSNTDQHGNKAAWQNPVGGFGVGCTTWGVRATCVTGDAAHPDQTFRLVGTSATYPPPAPPPSNAITVGKPKLNKKKGTAKLPVTVPGPGGLTLSGKGVGTQRLARASASRAVTAAGTVSLAVKPKGKTKKKLNKTGKAKVKVTVTFTPTGGAANAQPATIKLKKKLG